MSEPAETRSNKGGRIALAVAWVLSIAFAFALGHQTGSGSVTGRTPAAPAPTTAPTEPAAPTAAPTPDPEVAETLRKLPRRQADDPLALGRVDAKVVLTEWSDFRCPYCARWSTETLPALQPYLDDGTLRIEYRDLAVLGEDSVTTAVAARAAGRQGAFWPYYKAVFAAAAPGEHPNHTTADLVALARTAGVRDLARFETDLADPTLRAAVLADSAEAQQFGITGTPFFVVGTTVIPGVRPTESFVAAIEAAAKE